MNEKWDKLFRKTCISVSGGFLTPRDTGDLAREAIATEMERLKALEESHWDEVERLERTINTLRDQINFLEWTQYKS